MKGKPGRFLTICLGFVMATAFLAACTPQPEATKPAPVEITDQMGRQVTLEAIPQRIVSLAPSNTEILFALGLADRVVGVTDYCDYPPEAEEKPSIGGFSTPNIEEVVALSPDLILATSIHEAKVMPQLASKGLDVMALNPKTVDGVLEAIILTGEATGATERAAELVVDMQQRIDAVTTKTSGLTKAQRSDTFYIVWHDPLRTAGAGTLQDELIAKAGGTNTAGNVEEYAAISLEAIIAANPEVIIAGTSHGSEADQTFQYVRDEPRLRDTSARLNGRIYAIDSDLTSRPGPRIVVGLEQLAAFIHPELFE